MHEHTVQTLICLLQKDILITVYLFAILDIFIKLVRTQKGVLTIRKMCQAKD